MTVPESIAAHEIRLDNHDREFGELRRAQETHEKQDREDHATAIAKIDGIKDDVAGVKDVVATSSNKVSRYVGIAAGALAVLNALPHILPFLQKAH